MSVATVPGVDDVSCLLVSRIGRPVGDPSLADLRVGGEPSGPSKETERLVTACVRDELAGLPALRDALLDERVSVF